MTKEWHGDDIDTEDIVLETENNEPPKGGDCEKKVEKLKSELEKATAENRENLDGWQRAKADYVNLLKRFDNESKTAQMKGKVKAVETLLPAFDALERAKEHGEIPEGFAAIARQLESAFAALGLAELGAEGETFDPALHEAYGQDSVDTAEKDGLVTAVLEKGWRVGGAVIRPAKVRVAAFQEIS